MFYLNLVLQTYDEIERMIANDTATVQGVLIGVSLGLVAAVIFLYRENRTIQREYTKALKEFSERLIKLNESYNEFQDNYWKHVRKERQN